MKSLHSAASRAEGVTLGAFTAGSMSSLLTCALRPILELWGMEVGGAELGGGWFCETVMDTGFLRSGKAWSKGLCGDVGHSWTASLVQSSLSAAVTHWLHFQLLSYLGKSQEEVPLTFTSRTQKSIPLLVPVPIYSLL